MIGLLNKEWREHRGLVIGLALAAPVLSVLAKWLVFGWGQDLPRDSAIYILPGMFGLFMLAVAADLVAADSAAGRHVFLAAQPVRPGTVWAAKAVFLFGSASLFFGWLIVTETAIHVVGGHGAGFFLSAEAARWSFLLGIVPVLGAAALFWSTLIDRGFTAAFGAVFSLAIAFGVGMAFVLRYLLFQRQEQLALDASLVLTAAFLAGSFAAYAFSRIHLGGRIRRFALAFVVGLLVLAPPTAQAAIRLELWRDISPTDRDLHTWLLDTEPAGDWVFVGARRPKAGPLGATGGRVGPQATLAVNLADGRIRNLAPYGGPLSVSRKHEKTGQVRLFREGSTGEIRSPVVTDYDLEAGRPLRTRSFDRRWHPIRRGYARHGHWFDSGGDHVRLHTRDGTVVDLPKGLWLGTPTSWGIPVRRDSANRSPGVFSFEDGKVVPTTRYLAALPPTPEGCGLRWGRDGIWRVPLDGSEETFLFRTLRYADRAESPDGTRLIIADGAGVVVCSAGEGDVVRYAIPDSTILDVEWSPDGRSFFALDRDAVFVGQIGETGVRRFARVARASALARFDGRRLLFYGGTPTSLHMVVDGGEPVRIPAREASR
ncbi:MAG: hypothetical protein ABFS86_12770 [Planctomycetota bacterium]